MKIQNKKGSRKDQGEYSLFLCLRLEIAESDIIKDHILTYKKSSRTFLVSHLLTLKVRGAKEMWFLHLPETSLYEINTLCIVNLSSVVCQ